MNLKKNRKVFVTGASGFVGANVVRELLKKDYSVHILARLKTIPWRLKDLEKNITMHLGDVTNYKTVKKAVDTAKPAYIIHLATYGAYHYQNELEKIIQVNVVGTENLLRATKDIAYKCFINTGSSSEYGFKNRPMKETDVCNPASYYAVTKLCTTQMCKMFARLNNKPIVTFRLFSVYGKYEELTRFIPTAVTALIQQKPINLTPGRQRRDFIYVDDVCRAYITALTLGDKLQGEIVNIGTGTEHTNDEIIKALFGATAKHTIIKKGAYPVRSWDTNHWLADTSYAEKILRWRARTSIDIGLKKTYSWFVKNAQLYSSFYEKTQSENAH